MFITAFPLYVLSARVPTFALNFSLGILAGVVEGQGGDGWKQDGESGSVVGLALYRDFTLVLINDRPHDR
jgi:hypothetical protein